MFTQLFKIVLNDRIKSEILELFIQWDEHSVEYVTIEQVALRISVSINDGF